MDYLTADTLPWLHEPMARWREAWRARRLPQALLITSAPGLGAELLASWITALTLCESPSQAGPCGVCASCQLLRADTHPDFYLVRLEEDAQQIKVDQIRDLIESLSLSSYRSGYKLAIIQGAEALNANSANALLKTLEEPTDKTLLILITRPSHRLPATIASRCVKLQLRTPEQSLAIGWLAARDPGVTDWRAALALAGGAPLLALDLPASSIARLDEEMRDSLRRLQADTVDVTVLAQSWVKSDPALRLSWLENWITGQVHALLGCSTSCQSAEPVRLPAALLKPKIRALFRLLDASREWRRLASTGLNQQLALEALLLGGRAALAS
ncbi:MAG TPA: DNA polymerase III subunit delta' [Steroidobacteraceae bacterium]|nr:DNA polymerase III subunit delta' [Steroidobacteraceae bacterium]